MLLSFNTTDLKTVDSELKKKIISSLLFMSDHKNITLKFLSSPSKKFKTVEKDKAL
jgi:hypothetical protein